MPPRGPVVAVAGASHGPRLCAHGRPQPVAWRWRCRPTGADGIRGPSGGGGWRSAFGCRGGRHSPRRRGTGRIIGHGGGGRESASRRGDQGRSGGQSNGRCQGVLEASALSLGAPRFGEACSAGPLPSLAPTSPGCFVCVLLPRGCRLSAQAKLVAEFDPGVHAAVEAAAVEAARARRARRALWARSFPAALRVLDVSFF